MVVERKGRVLELAERVDPRSTALVVIDVQNDFLDGTGVMARLGHDMSAVEPFMKRLHRLIDAARRANILIVFVRASYDEVVLGEPFAESLNRRGYKESQCREGTIGAEWFGGIAPRNAPNEIVINKYRFSGFWGSTLDLHLRANGIETAAVLAGTATSGCVESTARDAFFLDYRVVLPTDCLQDSSAPRHVAALEILGANFGVALNSDEILAVWSKSPAVDHEWTTQQKQKRQEMLVPDALDPRQSALVLVDFQNDLCDPKGALAMSGEDVRPVQSALNAARELLDAARAAGALVIHVRTELTPLSASGANPPNLGGRRDVCLVGTWGAAFAVGIDRLASEPEVIKHRVSPFPDSLLDLLLRSNRIRTVVIAGTPTHGSVESAVRDARDRDFRVIVPVEAVGAPTSMRKYHAASLDSIRLGFGELVSTSSIKDAWRKTAPAEAET